MRTKLEPPLECGHGDEFDPAGTGVCVLCLAQKEGVSPHNMMLWEAYWSCSIEQRQKRFPVAEAVVPEEET
jgi:hypothetical protein